MASKLGIYNGALLALGQERLASLSEAITARYALDDAYDQTLDYCLEQGFWNFAMRAIQVDSSASVTPAFGYSFAFSKPGDFIRLLSMSAEATMRVPLLDFVDEPNFWFANVDPLFAKYVSDSVSYGGDLSLWSESYTNYVETRLAIRTCKRITGSDPSDGLKRDEKRALVDARSKDAMNEPPGFPPQGSWARSRSSSTSGFSSTDRGLR